MPYLILLLVLLAIYLVFVLAGVLLTLAGVVAGAAGAAGASAMVYFWYHPMAWCVRNRGGDRHQPVEGKNAYRQYLAGPVFSDFWFSLAQASSAARSWLEDSVLPVAERFMASKWTWALAFGIYLGVPVGVLGGLIGLALLSILGSGILVLTVAVALFIGFLLKVLERVLMRLAGAGHACPSCHRQFQLPVYRCPSCGAVHDDLLPGSLGILKRRCSCDRAEIPTLRATGRADVPAQCPHCEASLHGSIGGLRNVRIPIAGGTGAGKTTLCVGALESLAQLEENGQVRVRLRSDSAPLFANMVSDFGQAVVPAPTGRNAPAVLAEIAPESGRRGALLFAYDVAGELFNNLDELREQSMFSGFEGAVMIVDPFSLDSIRTQFPAEVEAAKSSANATDTRPEDVYQRMVEALTEMGAPVYSLPLAIVVTKIDALPTDASLDVAENVEDWLGEFGAGNLLLTATQDFGKVKCFASSALGGLPGEVQSFKPKGSLAPFAWLMEQRGVPIPFELGAGAVHVGGDVLLEDEPERSDAEFLVPPRNRIPYVPTGGHLDLKGAGAAFASIAIVVVGLASLTGSFGTDDPTAPFRKDAERGPKGGNGENPGRGGGVGDKAKQKPGSGKTNGGVGKQRAKQKAAARKNAKKAAAKRRANKRNAGRTQ